MSLFRTPPVLALTLLLLLSGASYSDTNGQPPALESVTLSKNSVPTWCPNPGDVPGSGCTKQDARIEVVSAVKNPNREPVHFIYVVTGGEIIGSGPRVIWDLHKAQPGKHSITVGIGEDMIVRGKTITKPVSKDTCPVCDRPCECPTITLRGPDTPVTAGDAFIVEAELRGGDQGPFPKYLWTVSEGTVIEGQGTSRALIRTDVKSREKIVEVTLEIDLAGACWCATRDTAKVTIIPSKP